MVAVGSSFNLGNILGNIIRAGDNLVDGADDSINQAARKVVFALGVGGQTLTNAVVQFVKTISNGVGEVVPGLKTVTNGVDVVSNKADAIVHKLLEYAANAGINVTQSVTGLISNAVNGITHELAPAPATKPAPAPVAPKPKPKPVAPKPKPVAAKPAAKAAQSSSSS